MAYDFTSASTQYLSVGSSPVSAFPVTMTVYGKIKSGVTAYQRIFAVSSNSNNNRRIAIDYDYVSTKFQPSTYVIYDSAGKASNATASVDTQIWSQATGVLTSATSRAAYLDGGNVGTGTADSVSFPANTNVMSIGALIYGANLICSDSVLAEAAIWNVALTADEVASLGKGFKPQRVRPQSLVFYAPLIRNLMDSRGGLTITNNNSATVADHPRVY